MDDKLATPACRMRNRILWIKSEPGELCLESGLVGFTLENGRLVFQAPLEEVRASYPKIFFPVLAFRIGVKLTVDGKSYRLSFVRVEYSGWSFSRSGSGASFGPTWSISQEDIKPAKAAVQQWRTVLDSR